jgi:predicted enzyme related to lactoylglutathione lyase
VNNVAHFAIHTVDSARAMRFYTQVFGWTFEPWGPPGFYMIGGAGIPGSLHKGERAGGRGLEMTLAVASIHETEAAIVAAGGTIAMPPMTIPTVGTLLHFIDTEGNELGAMQYV